MPPLFAATDGSCPDGPKNARTPAENRRGAVQTLDDPWGIGSRNLTHCPTEYRCYIKEGSPICNSGCGDPIVEKSFVLRANSPSRWHLTRDLLLCSRITIHDFAGNVNRIFPLFSSAGRPANSILSQKGNQASLFFVQMSPPHKCFPPVLVL